MLAAQGSWRIRVCVAALLLLCVEVWVLPCDCCLSMASSAGAVLERGKAVSLQQCVRAGFCSKCLVSQAYVQWGVTLSLHMMHS